jgi:hypothetical protein
VVGKLSATTSLEIRNLEVDLSTAVEIKYFLTEHEAFPFHMVISIFIVILHFPEAKAIATNKILVPVDSM